MQYNGKNEILIWAVLSEASQISQFCKSRRLFFIFGAIENQKNPKKV